MRSTLLIPLIVGLAAGVFSLYSLLNVAAEARKQAAKPTDFAEVLVAKQEIPYAAQISEDMLETVRVPKPHPLKNTLSDVKAVSGRVSAMRIVQGTPVLSNMLAPAETPPGAAHQIEPGYRTVSVTVPGADVEFLLPGDHVDVLYAAHDRRSKQRNMELIFSDVEVFSVGDERIGMGMEVPDPSAKDQKKGARGRTTSTRSRGGQTTVKLLLTFDKAKLFAAAKLNGDIALLPRPFDDDTELEEAELEFGVPEEPVVEAETPEEVEVTPPPPPPPPKHVVRVIQGGKIIQGTEEEEPYMRNEVEEAPRGSSPTVSETNPGSPQASGPMGYVPDLIERGLRASRERREGVDIGE